jgi:hypothetical protein
MFSGCTNLTTITVSNKWQLAPTLDANGTEIFIYEDVDSGELIYHTSESNTHGKFIKRFKTLSSENMFLGCTSLVGGSQTPYDSTKTDKAYARIDGGPEAPGYLTAAAGTQRIQYLKYNTNNSGELSPYEQHAVFDAGTGTWYIRYVYVVHYADLLSHPQGATFTISYNNGETSKTFTKTTNTYYTGVVSNGTIHRPFDPDDVLLIVTIGNCPADCISGGLLDTNVLNCSLDITPANA